MHNVQHASETTGVLFEKVKIRSLILAPLFNNTTDCGGAGRSSNFFFFLLCFKAKAVQNPDGRWLSLQSVFIPQDGFVNLENVIICNPDKFLTELSEMK